MGVDLLAKVVVNAAQAAIGARQGVFHELVKSPF